MKTSTALVSLLNPKDYSKPTRDRIDLLTNELSSGRRSDIGRSIRSDFSILSQKSHNLTVGSARQDSISRASTWLENIQHSLEAIEGAGARVRTALTTSLSQNSEGQIEILFGIAKDALVDISGFLNSSLGGRSLFGNGDSTGTPPIDIDELILDTQAIALSSPDVDTLFQNFDTYFAAGGGFDLNIVSDFPTADKSFPLGAGDKIGISVSARSEGIRDALKQAALAASLENLGFAPSQSDTNKMSQFLNGSAANASTSLTNLRAGVGATQERLELIRETRKQEEVRNIINVSNSVSADPFETSVKLQQSMTQLETIFAVTARRAGLKLTNFLR